MALPPSLLPPHLDLLTVFSTFVIKAQPLLTFRRNIFSPLSTDGPASQYTLPFVPTVTSYTDKNFPFSKTHVILFVQTCHSPYSSTKSPEQLKAQTHLLHHLHTLLPRVILVQKTVGFCSIKQVKIRKI